MAITKRSFGVTSKGEEATLYTLENSKGMKADVTDYGAILVNLYVPDKNGKAEDVVLGFDSVEGYEENPSFFGATIGPSANRIAGAKFTIDGVEYALDVNDGPNNLHSHKDIGYHKLLWKVTAEGENTITFTITDEDGYMGFPGNKELSLTYTLDEENGITLSYTGKSDKKTILNPTNHTYFNLDGHAAGSIEEHTMQLIASNYTPVVAGAIPTGEIAPVAGCPMDFMEAKVIGKEINADMEQLILTGGYDHNWVVDGWDGSLRKISTVVGPKSGRVMHTYTDLPGVQFYAGNFIDDQDGKDGAKYGKRSGLCLETQYFPNTINTPAFPPCVFGGDTEYKSVTVYRFE
ncbi:MAG: galactose mutarotase [Lachnospiraceae bacterium]|nr:galactose mutarotase [Lachnospiraceae bacterium]